MADPLRVRVVGEADGDAEELESLVQGLRRELVQLDVADIERPRAGPPPRGARAVDVVELGTLLVTLGTSIDALRSVVQTVSGWLRRGSRARTVSLEIDGDVLEITNASPAQQDQLVSLWLERHRSGT